MGMKTKITLESLLIGNDIYFEQELEETGIKDMKPRGLFV